MPVRRRLVSLMAVVVAIGVSARAQVPSASPGEEAFARVIGTASRADWLQVTPEHAKREIDADRPFILDVRTQSEWEREGHIGDATLIPVTDLPRDVAELPSSLDAPILVYCEVGTRGLYATLFLTLLGYHNARNVSGGFRAWTAAGLPVVGCPPRQQPGLPAITRSDPATCE